MRIASARTRAARPRDRRGVTAIIVVLTLTVLMGFTAFAVDFGRSYAFKAQLQTVADASAMAGALEILRATPLEAPTAANDYAARNPVENTAGVLESVEPGTFTDAAGFVPVGSFADPAVNAVRTTAVYTVGYTFGRVLGFNEGLIRAQAIGAIGSASRSACMKPWAVPMSNILHALGKTSEDPETYELTTEDVTTLRDGKVLVAFKVASQSAAGATIDLATETPISGNFYAVQYGAYRAEDGTLYDPGPSSGGDTYRKLIGGVCGSYNVKIGDWLYVENGSMIGPTSQGTKDLCGVTGGGPDFACDKEIELPIWNKFDGHKEVQVRYIGKFMVTGYVNDMVQGYLTSKDGGSGGFTGTPGPIQAAALVR